MQGRKFVPFVEARGIKFILLKNIYPCDRRELTELASRVNDSVVEIVRSMFFTRGKMMCTWMLLGRYKSSTMFLAISPTLFQKGTVLSLTVLVWHPLKKHLYFDDFGRPFFNFLKEHVYIFWMGKSQFNLNNHNFPNKW